MKYLSTLVFCLVTNTAFCLQKEFAEEMPPAIKSSIDKKFPDWKPLDVNEEIWNYIKYYVSADARPDIIKGDFDGDKQLDYAVLFRHGTAKPYTYEYNNDDVHLVVFLNRGNEYRLYELKDPGEYIMLSESGSMGFDFNEKKRFKFKKDGISSGFFEKSGWEYLYEKDGFKRIYSAD